MLTAWQTQSSQPEINDLGFDERFALLVDAEHLRRENLRLDRVLKEARLKLPQACLENVDYTAKREIDRALIRQLAGCRWVHEHHNILITGATGTGKTYLACALAQQACRNGYRAMYRRASRLFDELTLARADGSYARLLLRMARVDVLILDDWGLSAATDAQRQDLGEILEDRHGLRSTIVTSQLPVTEWHAYLADLTVADAICDRLLHNSHRVVLKGPSRRKEAKPEA